MLSPLAKTLHYEKHILGCVSSSSEEGVETVVFEGDKLVPLLGSDRREGLALGQHRTLSWLPGGNPEGMPMVTLRGPVWDPFTGSVYGYTYGSHAVVRLLHDASAVVVAGSVEQTGSQEGPGTSARFDCPTSLTTDGRGAMYGLDSNHVWKLALPAAWKKAHHDNPQSGCDAAAVAATAAAPGQQQRTHAARAGGGGGGSAQGQGPQGQMQGQGQEQVQVSILPCGQNRIYWYMAYDPLRQALILVSDCAVYRRALTAGAAEEPVLLAGCEQEEGDTDGVGAGARFRDTRGLVVDGTGAALVLNYNGDVQTTAVRRVGPDGKVTTIARDLDGEWDTPAILPNGYLALCDSRVDDFEDGPPPQLLVLDLGLTPNACHAAAPPPPPAGPKPHTLPADLSDLLASTSQQGGGSADVVVRVGDKGFRAHRAVLGARSTYFRQRLDPGAGFGEVEQPQQQEQQQQQELQQQHLTLPDASADAFELVLRYMYTDSVGDIPAALLQPVAELADRLLLPGLCEEAGRQMLAAVCAESVVGLLLWAEQRSASFGELLLGLKVWVREHREEVVVLPGHTKRLMGEAPDLAYELFFGALGGDAAKRQRLQ